MKRILKQNIILFLSIVALIIINLIPKISPRDYMVINNYIDIVETTNSFKYYNLAEAKIGSISDEHLKRKLQTKLGIYSSKVYTQDIKDALYWLGELWAKNDLWSYEVLRTYVLDGVKSEEDRSYLKEQLVDYGKKRIFTKNLLYALQSIDRAWINKNYIKEAEQNIINKLSDENPWNMAYLQGQLNMIKAKNKEKEQILIIGDSITLGIGADYLNKKPITKVQDAWWNKFLNSKYEFSTMAVGGIGVLNSGMTSGLELVKFIESASTPSKVYNKIIIALSTNDVTYSSEEYERALMELVNYIKNNYSSNQLLFVNFHNFEDVMEKVSKLYRGIFIDINMDRINKYDTNIDNIHPSSRGQEEIYKILKDYL
ncbi:SGNH/GDSL hydrolase family protein [Desnuesiella massiliensis]|uniref:SGNH/GDSL hydrolase family protein n=1 Tax=Desnuesiella massiliensis TaxID=1650662 RepID=UPI0006E3DB33|nr:SGNH/GDSL hydrolase family protein [Desnuesiella massiliensis]